MGTIEFSDRLMVRAGRPKSMKTAKANHLFKILANDVSVWMPDAGIHLEWFLIFSPDSKEGQMDAYLVVALMQYEVQTDLNELETTELPLIRMRDICDLELYVLAYLLGRHASLIGTKTEDLIELTRVLTPKVTALKEVIMERTVITVGDP